MYNKKEISRIYTLYFNKNLTPREINNKLKLKNSSEIKLQNYIKKNFHKKIPNGSYSELEKKYLLYMYKNCQDANKLAEYINSKNRISKKTTSKGLFVLASRNNIKKERTKRPKNSFINYNDEFEIIKLYKSGKSAYEIYKKYNFKTKKSVYDILRKHNIESRDFSDASLRKDSYSFECIDSKFKAYYLGILLTDGYVIKGRNNVSVQMIDKDIIEFINENTNGNFQIINKKNNKKMYRTSIYHTKYKDELKRLGVTENKSLTLNGPKLYKKEECYIPYILRGIIDGDGWVRKDGKEFFICSSSKDFIYWCKEKLESLNMEKLKVSYTKNDFNGIYFLRTARKENIEILKNVIYDIPFGMSRKFKLLK